MKDHLVTFFHGENKVKSAPQGDQFYQLPENNSVFNPCNCIHELSSYN